MIERRNLNCSLNSHQKPCQSLRRKPKRRLRGFMRRETSRSRNKSIISSYPCCTRAYSVAAGAGYTATSASITCADDSLGSNKPLDFTDHKKAFEDKSFWELSRALLVLKACSYQTFTVHSHKIFSFMERYVGVSLTSLLVKPFYDQFVSPAKICDIKRNMERVSASGGDNIILIVAEAINEPEEARSFHAKTIEVMEGLANNSSEKYMQIRLTAFVRMPLLKELSLLSVEDREKLSHDAAEYMNSGGSSDSLDWLTTKLTKESMIAELKLGLQLLADVGEKAVETNTVLMVDAEYINVNPAITALALALAIKCNTNSAVVWNTTQSYLKSSYDNLQWELNFAHKNGIHYGAKIVRGAYIVPESEAARLGNYPSPVHDSYEDTNNSYDRNIDWLLQKISSNPSDKSIRFVLASHNQQSVQRAIQRMNELKVSPTDKKVVFGQIYGMYDHISCTLSKAGYPALKSMAVGSVSESLPYLARRTQENTAVMAGTRMERRLLKAELLTRIKPKLRSKRS